MQQVIIEMHKNLMGLRDIRDVERVYESFGLELKIDELCWFIAQTHCNQ